MQVKWKQSQEVRILMDIKSFKKILLFIIISLILLHMCSCDKIKDGISPEPTDTILAKDSISPNPELTDTDLVNESISADPEPNDTALDKENYSQFTKSSLQDGTFHILGNDIITSLRSGTVFINKPEDGKYPFSSYSSEYLGFNVDDYESFSIDKIFTYGKKIVYIGEHRKDAPSNDVREIIIQDTDSSHRDVVMTDSYGTGACYIKNNRLYFDEYYGEDYRRKKYNIKYLNLDTLQTFSVCEYDEIRSAYFALREDGSIAFLLRYEDGVSEIITFSEGNYTSVVRKRWLELIDYDMRGLYYVKPSLADEELSKLENDAQINSRDLVLKSENGIEKLLITKRHINFVKVFDDFFLFINHKNSLFGKTIEKYNMEGKLLKKIDLKEWPSLGKAVLFEAKIIYYQGKILNVFYRGDAGGVLEVETVNIE